MLITSSRRGLRLEQRLQLHRREQPHRVRLGREEVAVQENLVTHLRAGRPWFRGSREAFA
jgi:hypothetical protein